MSAFTKKVQKFRRQWKKGFAKELHMPEYKSRLTQIGVNLKKKDIQQQLFYYKPSIYSGKTAVYRNKINQEGFISAFLPGFADTPYRSQQEHENIVKNMKVDLTEEWSKEKFRPEKVCLGLAVILHIINKLNPEGEVETVPIRDYL